jgi:hypothetical protein
MSTPTTTETQTDLLEEFAEEFREMGVVTEATTSPARDQVKIVTKPKGVNVTNVRLDGFEFDLDDCWVNNNGTLTLWFTVNDNVGTRY